jgi:small subunit ribosomal protein S1
MDEGHDGKEIEHENGQPESAGEDLDEAERRLFLDAMQGEIEAGTTRRGEMVKGSIVAITDDFAVVDLGGKSEGIISLAEIKGDDDRPPAVGDDVEACVLSSGSDGVVLSRQLAKGIRDREFLDEAARSRIPVQGRVVSRNKGGFDVEVAGIRAFCPISQIELRYCEDPDVHLEQKYNFIITKYDVSGRRPDLVLSRRALLEAEARKMAAELRKSLAEGDILEGSVRSIRDFGAFIDLGGLDGLLPVSEISYNRVSDPREVLKEGEQIHVQVISIEQGGERITLSLKRLEVDPWDEALVNFPEGSRLTGKVVRLEPFGAFVQLAPGVDGLIHISNLNVPERVSHPRQVLQLEGEVAVEVLSVDPQQRRIGLARVPEDGEFGEVPVVGAVVEGKVDSVANFGVFVTLGPGRKGLVPNVEMGTSRGEDHRKQFKPGTPIKVKVLEVTENGRRISLSRKAALQEAERADFDKYAASDGDASQAGFGTLGDLLKKIK